MHQIVQKLRLVVLGLTVLVSVFAFQTISRVESSPLVATPGAQQAPAANRSAIQLPPLPYDYAALEPHIDAETMKIHHDKHHAAYVNNLNNVLQKYPNLQNRSVEDMVGDLNGLPEEIRTAVRNNGGGHLNHAMFWEIMSPQGGGQPTGPIAQAINQSFGSFEKFKEQFNAAGAGRFGSGWVWLIRNAQGQLEITTTPNQDTPWMEGIYPIMGNDVWEHAYYLKYRNLRADYLKNWWNVVNWREINRRFVRASRNTRPSPAS